MVSWATIISTQQTAYSMQCSPAFDFDHTCLTGLRHERQAQAPPLRAGPVHNATCGCPSAASLPTLCNACMLQRSSTKAPQHQSAAQCNTAAAGLLPLPPQGSAAQHCTAQRSTAQRSSAQRSTAQHSNCPQIFHALPEASAACCLLPAATSPTLLHTGGGGGGRSCFVHVPRPGGCCRAGTNLCQPALAASQPAGRPAGQPASQHCQPASTASQPASRPASQPALPASRPASQPATTTPTAPVARFTTGRHLLRKW
jgi:hypothetical protein